jgi:hypothetical protein
MGGREDARLILHWDVNKAHRKMKRCHFILHGLASSIFAGELYPFER